MVVTAKSATVREMLVAVTTLPLESLEAFLADPRMTAAGESYLRRALEALLDLGRHLLAKGFGIAASEYKEIPRHLHQVGILDGEQAALLTRMAGYRNRLVHFYDEVTPEGLYRILTEHRDDVEALLGVQLAWLGEHPERVEGAG
jgi:uncharacterized protein YutE (UPF0331/DUF86 family)